MSNDTKAARALVAYFNHQLAVRLVRRILKERSAEAWKRLADEVLGLIPKACQSTVWQTVLKHVEEAVSAYMASKEFGEKVDRLVRTNADRWIAEALEREAASKAQAHVQRAATSYPTQEHIKNLPGRLQALIDVAATRIASEKAAAVVSKS